MSYGYVSLEMIKEYFYQKECQKVWHELESQMLWPSKG